MVASLLFTSLFLHSKYLDVLPPSLAQYSKYCTIPEEVKDLPELGWAICLDSALTTLMKTCSNCCSLKHLILLAVPLGYNGKKRIPGNHS